MQLCLSQCVGLQVHTYLSVCLSRALWPLSGPHTSWSKSVVNNFSVQAHVNLSLGNFLKFVTRTCFKAYILRKTKNNLFFFFLELSDCEKYLINVLIFIQIQSLLFSFLQALPLHPQLNSR